MVRSSAPVDPRLADPAKRAALRSSSNYDSPNYWPFVLAPPPPGAPSYHTEGAILVAELWNARTDATQDCTTVAAHTLWWRTSDAQSTWQFTALTVAPLAVIGMFLFAVIENRISRERSGLDASVSAYRTCAVTSLLNPVLFLVIWLQLI